VSYDEASFSVCGVLSLVFWCFEFCVFVCFVFLIN